MEDMSDEDISIIMNLKQKAKEKVYLDAVIHEYRTLIDSAEELTDPYLILARKCLERSKKLGKKKITSNYYFVSIAPKQGITIDELRIKTEKYVNRRIILGAIYTYEWNKQDMPHTHILVYQEECSDADFRKNTKNTFKNLVGNLKCIDIKRVPDDWIADKIAYIKGEKWDEDKAEMISIDKQKRLDEGLEPYYIVGSGFADHLLDEANPTVNGAD